MEKKKKGNYRKCKTHWYLVLLFCVWSPVTCLYPNTIYWLNARRKERTEMCLWKIIASKLVVEDERFEDWLVIYSVSWLRPCYGLEF